MSLVQSPFELWREKPFASYVDRQDMREFLGVTVAPQITPRFVVSAGEPIQAPTTSRK